MYPSSSRSNLIYNNHFNNTNNVNGFCIDSCLWNTTEKVWYTYDGNPYYGYLGNYFSDYSGYDTNEDGVGEDPYEIDMDQDNYPLMTWPIEILSSHVRNTDTGKEFPTIQTAIDDPDTQDGDTLVVKKGIYTENVDVYKTNITIRSNSGNPFDTIVQAASISDHVFHVTADGVKISGFSITGASDSGNGIYLEGVEYCLIENNELSKNDIGIILRFSSNNKLNNNTASNNIDYGIWLYYSNNNTLSNNTADSKYYGIYLESSSGNTLNNNTASNNIRYGIYLEFSSGNTLNNNTASDNDRGIYLDLSDRITLNNNTVSNNDRGIYLYASSSNTLENNTASNNIDYGIYLWDSSNNFIYNNYFNNTNNAYFEGTNIGNIWNTAKTPGSNIVGGPYLGGNFWANPDGTVYPEGGKDVDHDGIFDSQYNIEGSGFIDYLPLRKPGTMTITVNNGTDPVADFESIQDAVNAAHDGDTVLVYPGTYTENVDVDKNNITIRSESGNPLDTIVQAASSSEDVFHVTADGVKISGFNITGASGTERAGIYLEGVEYCLIENNKASNNEYGINLWDSNENTLENNTASNNNVGIYLISSSGNTVSNNTALYNSGGIGLYGSQYGSYENTLENNTASNNSVGIFLWDFCKNNILSNNTASDNGEGIRMWDSRDTTLVSNKVSNNDDGIALYSSSSNTLSNNNVSENICLGIYLEDSSSNTLENNTASNNAADGIVLDYSDENMLSNNIANSNNWNGINLEGSNGNVLINNAASNNAVNGITLGILEEEEVIGSSYNMLINNEVNSNNECGIYLDYSSDNNTLSNNYVLDNGDGIFLYFSCNNTLTGNTATSNELGIYLSSSSDNSIYNNYFNNTNNAYFEGTNTGNIWDTTKTAGSNIVGGSYLGGNFWATPTGKGFSQTHDDADGDGICDLDYDLGGGNIDYLPLVLPSSPKTSENGDDVDIPVIIPEDSDESSENIVITETSQQYVQKGVSVNYVFQNPENCIVDVSFVPEKTVGFVIAKVEILYKFPSEVLPPPKGIIYKIMNIQVGNTEFSSSENNFKNATIKLRVEKSWINENTIDASTITLNRYSEGK